MRFLRARPATLLEIDAAANLGMGALLWASPPRLIGLLGLPPAGGFYARVLGGVLSGIGVALVFARLRFPDPASGLGLAGAVAINLCGAAAVVGMLRGGLQLPARGRAALWLLAGFLMGLSALELRMRRADV